MNRIPVAVLGATGTVGQQFVSLLEKHPQFSIVELVASPRNKGKRYKDACNWKLSHSVPSSVADMIVKTSDSALSAPVLFSGLDSSVAGPIEERYAHDGHIIISNAVNHRMDPDVPLVIPEVNPEHFDLIKKQPYKGVIITNSNCSTMFLTMVLAPLKRAFGLRAVHVTTMQAISGAGYPGVPAMDILSNVIPFILGEEEKMEQEAQKILGSVDETGLHPAEFLLSAQCNRVPVYDGHTESVVVEFTDSHKPDIETVRSILESFSGIPQELDLPSAPKHPIIVLDEPDRPQPRRDIYRDGGMVTFVGRLRTDPIADMKMVVLGHNTIRGAAGAAILNAEALVALGYSGL